MRDIIKDYGKSETEKKRGEFWMNMRKCADTKMRGREK